MQLERILRLIEQGRKDGTLVCGGARVGQKVCLLILLSKHYIIKVILIHDRAIGLSQRYC